MGRCLILQGWNELIQGVSLDSPVFGRHRLDHRLRLLGYGKDEPWKDRSKSKQEAFNREMNVRTERFLLDVFCPVLEEGLSDELRRSIGHKLDPMDNQTVLFAYPAMFSSPVTVPMIRLEMGALAAWTPAQHSWIIPYAAEAYPALFSHAASSVLTAAPERTFWEKATILHHEANRPPHSSMPARYARHYYDLYQMLNSPVKTIAMNQMDLLHCVVAFKSKFYPRTWANYHEAKPGTIRLVPPEIRVAALKTDYSAMGDMIFGSKPSFEDILTVIQRFEDEINRLV